MYIGSDATAIINPITRKYITTWKTGTKLKNKIIQ